MNIRKAGMPATFTTRFFRHAFLVFALVATARASALYSQAMELVAARRYPEARDILLQVVAAEPQNAPAWYQLGIIWAKRHDDAAMQEAMKCLARAVDLEPHNAKYLGDYGGVSLEVAGRTRSITAAFRGRDALEKAVALNPNDLDAREGLFQYYTRAPFFAGGSSGKAAVELAEITRLAPDRGTVLAILTKANARDYAGAFKLCDDVLRREPSNYTALYQYGRTASVSGQNLSRGLECLQKSLTLKQPGPAAPTHSNAWYRIGDIQQKLGHKDEARAAYEAALKLDPANRQASTALDKLRRATAKP
ncbi:MAG TPA: tetratricopeptide repeat protein [Opitutaceae bacterium]|nr:tetratricopeptide repeat protein [Opitutaceae bacterium]